MVQVLSSKMIELVGFSSSLDKALTAANTSLETSTPPDNSLLGIVNPLSGVTLLLAHSRLEL